MLRFVIYTLLLSSCLLVHCHSIFNSNYIKNRFALQPHDFHLFTSICVSYNSFSSLSYLNGFLRSRILLNQTFDKLDCQVVLVHPYEQKIEYFSDKKKILFRQIIEQIKVLSQINQCQVFEVEQSTCPSINDMTNLAIQVLLKADNQQYLHISNHKYWIYMQYRAFFLNDPWDSIVNLFDNSLPHANSQLIAIGDRDNFSQIISAIPLPCEFTLTIFPADFLFSSTFSNHTYSFCQYLQDYIDNNPLQSIVITTIPYDLSYPALEDNKNNFLKLSNKPISIMITNSNARYDFVLIHSYDESIGYYYACTPINMFPWKNGFPIAPEDQTPISQAITHIFTKYSQDQFCLSMLDAPNIPLYAKIFQANEPLWMIYPNRFIDEEKEEYNQIYDLIESDKLYSFFVDSSLPTLQYLQGKRMISTKKIQIHFPSQCSINIFAVGLDYLQLAYEQAKRFLKLSSYQSYDMCQSLIPNILLYTNIQTFQSHYHSIEQHASLFTAIFTVTSNNSYLHLIPSDKDIYDNAIHGHLDTFHHSPSLFWTRSSIYLHAIAPYNMYIDTEVLPCTIGYDR